MTGQPARWERVEELLNGALDRAPGDRSAFLDVVCGADEALRREVMSLVEAHERPGALDRLAEHIRPFAVRLREGAEPAVGTNVGPYRLLERIGGGGMGVVYRACDLRCDRAVALKLMQPRFTEDVTALRRFQIEASCISALDHPNICTVHEVGETDEGRLYLAMPLYEGETLRQRIGRGPLPIESAVDIAVQITRGLAKAHEGGIVHRDIKPSNVFLCMDGTARLLDFGIAKLAGVTLTGSVAGPLGTVAYMSPEQVRGDRLDARTDIWSLGVVLYEMLAGRRPWGRSAVGVVVNAIVHGHPEPVSKHRADVPAPLVRALDKALAKSPEARYSSARSFEADLLTIVKHQPVP